MQVTAGVTVVSGRIRTAFGEAGEVRRGLAEEGRRQADDIENQRPPHRRYSTRPYSTTALSTFGSWPRRTVLPSNSVRWSIAGGSSQSVSCICPVWP